MSEDPSQLDPRQQADDRLVHALLVHVHDAEGAAHRETRIDQVLTEIHREQTSVRFRLPRRQFLAAAAVLLVAFGVIAIFSSTTPARASLTDILTALAKPGDRTYRLSVTPSDEETHTRHGLDGATLYLRDGRQYLLQRTGPNGVDLFDGFDGQQSWRIRAGQLAESQVGPGAGGVPMPQGMLEISFVDLQQTFADLQSNYTINPVDDQTLAGTRYRHVLAHRHENARGPATIEIWADPATGLPHRIVFDRAKFQGSPNPRRLTFDLSSQAPLPPDWFSPAGHVSR